MIYELSDNVDALRISIETINREMFKNGFEVVEKYKYKCNNCGKEFDGKPSKNDAFDRKEGAPEDPDKDKAPASHAKKLLKNQKIVKFYRIYLQILSIITTKPWKMSVECLRGT
jgi:hypothetical protein